MTNQQMPASVNDFVSGITNSVVILFPRIFWAFVLVGAGIVLAWIFKKITLKTVRGLDNLFERAAEQKGLQHIQIKEPLESFIGETVFWLSLLFFFVLAIHILQLAFLTSFLEELLNSIPLLAIGILIIIASFFIGSICRQIVTSAFDALQIEQAELLGNGIKILVVLIGILIGVGQIGIDISFLTSVVSVSFGAILGALALAFGFGARTYVANIISSAQIRKLYQNGDTIIIENKKGKITEINATMVLLQSDEGQTAMPAKLFMEKTSVLVTSVEKDEA